LVILSLSKDQFGPSLVPKLHLGTHLLRQFYCRSPARKQVSAK
jgi:hypothetical protein